MTSWAASVSFLAARIAIAFPVLCGAGRTRLIFQPEEAHHRVA
jgi:hypothetical protein